MLQCGISQMITYMHISGSPKGVFIYPETVELMDHKTGVYKNGLNVLLCTQEIQEIEIGKLNGNGGSIEIIGVNIPQKTSSYSDFENKMEEREIVLLDKVSKL